MKIEEKLIGLGLQVRTLEIHEIDMGKADFSHLLISLSAGTTDLLEHEIQDMRQIFKAVGTDPSRYRPSAEALIRRLINGKSIPSINPVVDINNYISIRYRIPIGVYDLDEIRPPVEVRVGREGERYQAINNRIFNLRNKIAAFDRLGGFGSPISDSRRTMTTFRTRNLFVIFYAPRSARVDEAMKEYLDLVKNLRKENHV